TPAIVREGAERAQGVAHFEYRDAEVAADTRPRDHDGQSAFSDGVAEKIVRIEAFTGERHKEIAGRDRSRIRPYACQPLGSARMIHARPPRGRRGPRGVSTRASGAGASAPRSSVQNESAVAARSREPVPGCSTALIA